jgi:hypothetical protein
MITGFLRGFKEGGLQVRDEISQPAGPNLQKSKREINK